MFSRRFVRLTALLGLACAVFMMIGLANALPPKTTGPQDLVRATPHPARSFDSRHGNTLDEVYTQLRYQKTTDYGVSWSAIQTAGDIGTLSHTRGQLPDFCTIVTNDNNICYVVFLDSAGTPGVYSLTGPNFSPVLVMAEGSNNLHTKGGAASDGWTSIGKDPAGNLYALMWGLNSSGANTFWGAKSTDNGGSWGTPFVIATNPAIDSTAAYPHFAQMNGASTLFMIFEQTNPAGGWDQYLGKVPTGGGAAVISLIGNSGEQTRNYYVAAVQPIAYDPTNNWLYCTFWNASANGDVVYYSNNQGASWSSSNLSVSVRYPSVCLNIAAQTPYVVSNFGVPSPGVTHSAWFSYDQLNYGSGSFIAPPDTLARAPAPYDGTRPLMYINTMYWWDANRGAAVNNIWGSNTPEGLSTEYTADGGSSWIGFSVHWNTQTDTINAATTTMNQIAGGTNGIAYVTSSFTYGATDRTDPVVGNQQLLTPATSTGPYTVSADVSDNNSVAATTINWRWYPADTATYVFQSFDSAHVTDQGTGSGTYFFSIPDTASNGHHWAQGDTIWFFVDCTDGNNNYTQHYDQAIVVGVTYLGIGDQAHFDVNSIALVGNYPNPFNPTTQITFDLPAEYRVTLKVYNMLGQQVATIANGQPYEQGRHSITFDGTDLASGIYFYTMSAGPYFATHKMVLLK